MATTDPDGAVLYEHPDEFAEITFNGVSILDQHPISIKRWPDGWGWVLLQVDPTTNEPLMWIDGQMKSYFKYGLIEVIP